MFFQEEDMNIELIGVFKLKREKGMHNSTSDRYYESLSMRISGGGVFSSKNKQYSVGQKEILYLPQSTSYSQSTKGETIIAIHFMNNSGVSNNSLEIITLDNYKEIQTLLQQMYSIWNEKKPGYRYECTSMLYHVLYLIKQQTHNDMLQYADANQRINAALDYIHQHYKKEQISIENLARMTSLSEPYFRKLFKRIYQISPNRYIINLRLEYAAQLLQSRLYTIAEVSEKSGFNDVKYFERLFKQKFTITPGAYKKQPSKKIVF